jgi:uncharacterized phage-associated protein
MPEYLKTAFVRDLESQVMMGKLSYTRMLDLIQDEVIKNYMKTPKSEPVKYKVYIETKNIDYKLIDKFLSSEDCKVVEEIWKKYFPKNSVIGFE